MNRRTCGIPCSDAGSLVRPRFLVGPLGQPFEFTFCEFVVWDLLDGFWGKGIDRFVADEILGDHGVHKC